MTIGDISHIIFLSEKEFIKRGKMKSFRVIFYRTQSGDCPIVDFLHSLDDRLRAKMARNMDLLEKNGNELREPFSKHLEDGIFELRTQQGSDITRALYFFCVGHEIILTHGFVKKTQKTPKREIELAKKYRADYMERQGQNE